MAKHIPDMSVMSNVNVLKKHSQLPIRALSRAALWRSAGLGTSASAPTRIPPGVAYFPHFLSSPRYQRLRCRIQCAFRLLTSAHVYTLPCDFQRRGSTYVALQRLRRLGLQARLRTTKPRGRSFFHDYPLLITTSRHMAAGRRCRSAKIISDLVERFGAKERAR